MYDLSSKFNTFYKDHVVLSQADQNELHNKKNLNIQRLKDGLAEYNVEHSTSYKVVDICVQGSVVMSTVIQNDNKEYDIDVAVVFDKKALGDKGALATTICGSLCHHYKYQPVCCNYSFLALTKSGE